MIVLARGVQDQIRFELPQDGQDEPVQNVVNSFVRGARREGDVQSASQCLRPAHLIDEARARVKGVAVLMEGDAEHIRIVPEDLLGSVAMMHIGIDDGDLLVAVLRPQVLDHDGHVVDVTKAAVSVHHAHAVMAGRAHQSEAVSDLALLQGVG
ncbi:Uncharacterised protein [uncultured archaeon]|nr:Uncharacterised protein [uncultured archaeon]